VPDRALIVVDQSRRKEMLVQIDAGRCRRYGRPRASVTAMKAATNTVMPALVERPGPMAVAVLQHRSLA
jgi:hypothetical protein